MQINVPERKHTVILAEAYGRRESGGWVRHTKGSQIKVSDWELRAHPQKFTTDINVEESVEPRENLNDMTVKELRNMAKEQNIQYYSSKNKTELIEALR